MMLLVLLLACGGPPKTETAETADTAAPQVPTDLSSCFFDLTCPYALSVGHRGDMLQAPENTLPAFQRAFDEGLDGVEMDVRTTADGVLVLMHDSTVDRTTDGEGDVSNLTWAQIQALTIPSEFEGIPDQRVPTFLEALQYVATTDLVVDIDVKSTSAEALMEDLAEAGMSGRVFLNTGSPEEAASFRGADPSVAIMPNVGDVSELEPYASFSPELVEVDLMDTAESREPVAALGARLFTQTLGIEAGRVTLGTAQDLYRDTLEAGATVIQTDYGEILAPFLEEWNRARVPDQSVQ